MSKLGPFSAETKRQKSFFFQGFGCHFAPKLRSVLHSSATPNVQAIANIIHSFIHTYKGALCVGLNIYQQACLNPQMN